MTSRTHTHSNSSDTVFASGAASERKEAYAESAAQVRSYFERWNRLEDAKAELAEDLKGLFAEAKSNGHHPKALRIAFREERRAGDVPSADDMEVAALVEMYRAHIGLTYAQARDAREASPKSEPARGFLTSAEDGRGRQSSQTPAPGRSNSETTNGEKEATVAGSASAAAPVDANSGARVSESAPALSSDDLAIPEFLKRTPKENSVPA